MNEKIKNKKGFSVAELIVVIGIFVLMSTISIFEYNDHMDKIKTTDLSQDIALTIRQAQVYGISASAGDIGSEDFDAEDFFGNNEQAKNITQDRSIRGVSFYFNDKKIVIFEDVNRNNAYDSSSDRMIDEREITYSDTNFINFNMCDNACTSETSGRLDITFERPYPDAIIKWFPNAESTENGQPYNKTIIRIGSGDYEKTTEINSIGNIVVI